jgi:hypothetical protein
LPLVDTSVAGEVVVAPMVTTFPGVPVMFHKAVVVVEPLVNKSVWATVFVLAISLKVLFPEKVNVDIPVAPPMVSLLYSKPPPIKLREDVDVSLNSMLAVFLLRVSPVFVTHHIFEEPVIVHKPEPIVTVLVLSPIEVN